MALALVEGRKALPDCLPNPPVGCVIVRDEVVVASGYTQAPGYPHAEASALHNFDGDLQDCSIFVTLEPCSFVGRTPSCAHALVSRKVKHVYVSILDPDPRNNGKGIEILKNAGIEVSVGALEAEVKPFIQPYLNLAQNKKYNRS